MFPCHAQRRVLLAIVIGSGVWITPPAALASYQPAPGGAERNQPAQQQPARQKDKPAPGDRPTDPTAITQLRELQQARPRQDAAKSSGNSPEWWTVGLSLATFAATFVVALAAWLTYCVYREILATNRQIERAYIKMSHFPPGLNVESMIGWSNTDPVPKQNASVRIAVRNHGNTPGEVTCWLLKLVITDEPLPDVPSYAESEVHPGRVFLVKGSSFKVTQHWPIAAETIQAVRAGTHRMYVLGYVDYVDRFGCRHRAGYARVYDPRAIANNNLPFVTESGYNYDRARKQGEGGDWSDKRA